MKLSAFFISLLALFTCGQAFADTPACDALTNDAKAVAQSSLNSIKAYGCCPDTISSCLKKQSPDCKTPDILANEICRLAGIGKSAAQIQELITNRAKAMSPDAKIYEIEIKPEHIWGNPEAKTILSVYLCGRCPYCSRHVPQLIRALEKSPLKDKIAVNLRYFPIKSHDNSTPAALAIEASAQLGQAWPYLIKSYDNFDTFTLNKITVWAQELGMDTEKLNALMKDPNIRNIVANSKREGLKNGVTTTPTFFLNGRRIEGSFDVDSMMSMIEEAAQ